MERTYKFALHFVPTTTPVIYTCLNSVSKLCFIYNKYSIIEWESHSIFVHFLIALLTNARPTQTNIKYNKLPKFYTKPNVLHSAHPCEKGHSNVLFGVRLKYIN